MKVVPKVVPPNKSELLFFIFGNIPGNLSNVSLRTNIVNNLGKFRNDLPYAGDCEFWSRAASKYAMGVEETMITHVRRHPGVASIHLNRKGELLRQNMFIMNQIYKNLTLKNPSLDLLLKLHASINYDGLQRYVAFRYLLKGKMNYMSELNRVAKEASYLHSLPILWILFTLTAGARLGRVFIAQKLIKSLG